MPDPISTLALATGGAFLGKFVGPAAEHLGKLALERAQQLGQKATAMLTAMGREPQPVELKLLVPLVQAASLETNESLIEKWTALLANAADPSQHIAVQPGFVEILRQLTPTDARVVKIAAGITPVNHVGGLPGFVQVASLNKQLEGLPAPALAVSIGNLTRLGIYLGAASQHLLNDASSFLTPTPRFDSVGPGLDFVQLTPFGRVFLAAVTPPSL